MTNKEAIYILEDIKRVFATRGDGTPFTATYNALNKAIKLLEQMPREGEWEIDEYGIYHCPICHAINNTVYKNFCPNCGARMDPK